ncbi:MAG: cobalt-precorrin-5B (C(1))-methyltransferase [Synechococcaceae cyanobacterium RL_1_2]|nr:cobalt-precorrin-5B (C(1))-methyltransferase [Synechococcaceae cyanobacterium RL_1_2]
MLGYTLPVFVTASAIAAISKVKGQTLQSVSFNLINPDEEATIAIEQVAKLGDCSALAITRSDPGQNLDLTRHTPIWVMATLTPTTHINHGEETLELMGGEGLGKKVKENHAPAIYAYAQKLLLTHVKPLIPEGYRARLEIVLPEGEQLALKTSNAAFGVVEGLSLLGTTGISQPLTAPDQLMLYQEELKVKAQTHRSLMFCIGENGLALAQELGIDRDRVVKTANWLGSMLAEAGAAGVTSIVLLGYHGKLIKLAGGIFHTHHHVADGRREIFSAYCSRCGVAPQIINQGFEASTIEDARQILFAHNPELADRVYQTMAQTIDERSQEYIYNHSSGGVMVGSILFDRRRQILVKSPNAHRILPTLC